MFFLGHIDIAIKLKNIQQLIPRITLLNHFGPSLHSLRQDPQRRLTEQLLCVDTLITSMDFLTLTGLFTASKVTLYDLSHSLSIFN